MKKVIVIITVLIMSYALYAYFSTPISGDDNGRVTIILVDESNQLISEEILTFTEEISLFELLDSNYNIEYNEVMLPQLDEEGQVVFVNSHIILGIDDLQSDWSNSYIQIFIDDIPSQYGADLIMIKDGETYTFQYTSLGGASE